MKSTVVVACARLCGIADICPYFWQMKMLPHLHRPPIGGAATTTARRNWFAKLKSGQQTEAQAEASFTWFGLDFGIGFEFGFGFRFDVSKNICLEPAGFVSVGRLGASSSMQIRWARARLFISNIMRTACVCVCVCNWWPGTASMYNVYTP